jgi:hypothetical protein
MVTGGANLNSTDKKVWMPDKKPQRKSTANMRLAAKRNWGKGRLYYLLNNLRTFTSSNVCTPEEEVLIQQAINLLQKVGIEYSYSNKQLGLKK